MIGGGWGYPVVREDVTSSEVYSCVIWTAGSYLEYTCTCTFVHSNGVCVGGVVGACVYLFGE